jgi:maltose O-acetyltransferase
MRRSLRHKAGLLWSWLVMTATGWLPDLAAVQRLRGWLLSPFLKRRGRDFQVASGARIASLANLAVGDHVYVGPGAIISAGLEVTLGDGVMLGHYAVVVDGNHSEIDGNYRFGPRVERPIRIGRGTWVGAHATVVAGVTIGEGVVVAANAAVVRDIPDRVLVAGVPAQVVRSLARGDMKTRPSPPPSRAAGSEKADFGSPT